jgi:hypothetical protein
VTSTLVRSLLVLTALALAAESRAGDPFGAAPPPGPIITTPQPGPRAPIAEIAPYLSTHSSISAPDFRSGPSTLDDYRYLRTAPTTPEIALYGLVVRERPPLPILPTISAPLERPRSQLDLESCSADWFEVNACVLRLYTGEGRR